MPIIIVQFKKRLVFILYFYPLKANEFLYKHGLVNADNARQHLQKTDDLNSKNLCYPTKPLTFKPQPYLKNVLLIVIDSWNYQAMNAEVTPNISAFADSATCFTHHVSGSNGTRGGIFSIFYGLPALYWYDFEAENRSPVLFDVLLKNKYDLGIFTSASLRNPPFERTVFSKLRNIRLDSKGKEVSDCDIEITNEWINFTDNYIKTKKKTPFFGFLFYDAPHAFATPKNFPKKFKPAWETADYSNLKNTTDPKPFYNLYKNCVNFNDSLIGQVINDLRKKNLLDSTLVIITGDHGQEFNENHHNYWGHNGNFSQAQIGVPMIVWEKGRKPSKINTLTTHYDIIPTIFQEVLNCQNSTLEYALGYNLFDTKLREWHISGSRDNFAVIINKMIYTFDYNGSIIATDLQMNEKDDAIIDNAAINRVMIETNRFYNK